jgi:hypothetical protein
MKSLLIILAFASLTTCNTMRELPNGCFVDARHHQWVHVSAERVEGKSSMSMLIGFEWVAGGAHVIHAFEHKGQTWVYDPAQGSTKISNRLIVDPSTIVYLTYPSQPAKNIVLL